MVHGRIPINLSRYKNMSNNRMVLDSLAKLRKIYELNKNNLRVTGRLEAIKLLLDYKIKLDNPISVVISSSMNYSMSTVAGAIRKAASEVQESIVVSHVDPTRMEVFFKNTNNLEEIIDIIENIFIELIRQSNCKPQVFFPQESSNPNFESELITISPFTQQTHSNIAPQEKNYHSPFMPNPNNVVNALSYTQTTYDSNTNSTEKVPFITAHTALQMYTRFRHDLERTVGTELNVNFQGIRNDSLQK